MKTTLELPDTLMRRVKLRAVNRNQRLKDTIAQLLEQALATSSSAGRPHRPPKPVKLRGRGPLGIRDIEAAIGAGRE
ncbi:MAG: hypothetical protein ACRETB_02000 [Steroidobacteraceae bacterium]